MYKLPIVPRYRYRFHSTELFISNKKDHTLLALFHVLVSNSILTFAHCNLCSIFAFSQFPLSVVKL